MKVIFRKNVPGVAKAGEVKEAADGYVRNYLIPNRLAEPATPKTLHSEAERQQHQSHELQRATVREHREAARLHGRRFRLSARANEQGTLFAAVTAKMVSDILQQNGFAIAPDHIVLPASMKHLGEHTATLRFGSGEQASIHIIIERAA